MDPGEVSSRLNALLTAAGQAPLDGETAKKFADYLSLFIRWNQCINLSAIRDEEGVISRHIIESIIVTVNLPDGVSTLLDFGSGGGLPGIPIALCRPEIAVTLAESQGKKAAFLQEAARVLGLSAKVHAGRAETLQQLFDCVVLRAVDKMPKAVSQAAGLVAQGGWLALMTTQGDLPQLEAAAGEEFSFSTTCPLPGSAERVLALAQRMR
jgi:16S rRNA (guanine527-N7)-methyltransferase